MGTVNRLAHGKVQYFTFTHAEYYDEIVIPDVIGKAHPKAAITLRNRWMVDTADLIIAYIECEEGGAYSAVKYAKKLNKKVVNIGSAEDIENEENK